MTDRMDRRTRDEVIRIARERGVPFKVIAERVGLSVSRCRQIVKAREATPAWAVRDKALEPPADVLPDFRDGMTVEEYAAGLAALRSWFFGPNWLRPAGRDEPHLEAPALDESVPRRDRIRALREERELRFGKPQVIYANHREVVVPGGDGAAYNERMVEVDRQLRHLELLEAWPALYGDETRVLDEVLVPIARPRDGLD